MSLCPLPIFILFLISGHQSHSSYHGSPAHKECETHYKSIYKTVYEHKDIKECHDIPKKICEHLKEKVLRKFVYLSIFEYFLVHFGIMSKLKPNISTNIVN